MKAADLDALVVRAYANDPTLTGKEVNALLRACVTASPGKPLVVADFSGIEARVLAWASGDLEALQVFRTPGGDPYKRLASTLYGIPESSVTPAQRQLGKVTELAAGYGMGAEKLEATGAKMGVDWEASGLNPVDVVRGYRETHAPITRWWAAMQEAAVLACDGYTTAVGPVGLSDQPQFIWGPSPLRAEDVWLMLPSGRPLCYYRMRYEAGRRGPDLLFEGRKGIERTYSGKLTENAVQAFARELLGWTLVRAEMAGWAVVGHVHDEVLLEVDEARGQEALDWLLGAMREAPDWGAGLPLSAEGWYNRRYLK